jgi:GTPase
MSQNAVGNLKSLTHAQIKQIERLYTRRIHSEELLPYTVAKELYEIASNLRRIIGLLIARDGKVVEVVVGTKTILYLPDLGRYRLGDSRLRRLRLIVVLFPKEEEGPVLTQDLITDLEKLRLDAVCAFCWRKGRLAAEIATLGVERNQSQVKRELITDFGSYEENFSEKIEQIEGELSLLIPIGNAARNRAVLVHVSTGQKGDVDRSLQELKELTCAAGVVVADTVEQRRAPDPKSVLGKGKLEEVVLHCLRLGIEMIIFDCELRPTQWRNITNMTELKVLDRSMVILDVFSQRAQSNEGRLQVELAQLKYNLPRLGERDVGLSRLTGGIGGRGPGETKLELERRRSRDRITLLEKKIEQLSTQRKVRESRRIVSQIPLVVLVGYTNAGKSTLFNRLTGASVFVEDAMFATLDPTKRRVFLPPDYRDSEIILGDTVGFIRDLPQELMNAFRATLEDLHHATILIHVVDCSEEGINHRIAAVEGILQSMELPSEIETILIFNKSDSVDADEKEGLISRYPDSLFTSATAGDGTKELLQTIKSLLYPDMLDLSTVNANSSIGDEASEEFQSSNVHDLKGD